MARGPQHRATPFVGVLLLVGLVVPILAVAAPTSGPTTLSACTPGAPVAAVADSFIAVPLGSAAGEVWTYDSTSGVPLGSPITVGYDPVAMAVDTKYSELFVLNQGITGEPATVSVINYQTGFAVGATISLLPGDVPDAIIVSPGGNHVVVADTNQHSLTVINPVSPYTPANLSLSSSTVPSTLAFSDDADHLYVGDAVNGLIDELTYSSSSPWYTYTTYYSGYYPATMVTPSSSTYNTLFVGDDSEDDVHVFTIGTTGALTLNTPWPTLAQPPVGLADPSPGTALYVSFGGTMSGSGNTTHDQFDEIATATGNIVPEATPAQDSIGALAVNGDSTIVAMASTATGGQNVDRWAVVQNQSQDAVVTLGGVPSAIISVPAQYLRYYAYVAQSAEINSNDSGDVSVVDLLSDNDIADLQVGVDPQALAVTPDGSQVYVANAGVTGLNGSLSLITTADIGTSVNPVSTLTVPGLAFNGSTRLDAAVLSPSGEQLLLADYGNDKVYDVELGASSETTTSISLSGQPLAIVMSPSGNSAYVINKNDTSITVLTTSGQNQLYTLDGTDGSLSLSSPQGEAISPNGRTLYVSDTNGTTGILRSYAIGTSDGLTAAGTATLSTNAPGAVAVSPQGGTVYVALTNSGQAAAVVNAATLAVTTVNDSGDSSQAVATTPDGGKFLVADSGYCGDIPGSLAVFNTGQTTPTEVNFPSALGNSDPSAIAMSAGFGSPAPVQLLTRGELAGGGANPAEVATATAVNDVRAGVDTATGSYSLSLPGLNVASPGLPLGFSASYDSANAAIPSVIGDGWTFPYAMNIAAPTSGTNGNGCQYVVTQENGSIADFADVGDPGTGNGCKPLEPISDFGPAARVAATMGRPQSLTEWQGTSACPPGTGNCLIFQRQAGTKYFFSTASAAPYPLVGIQDIYGNTITLAYGVSGTCGSDLLLSATAQGYDLTATRSLNFTWQCPSGDDEIASVSDPLGRTITFAYNSIGELGQYELSGGSDRLANHQFEFAYATTGMQLVNWWDPDAVVLAGTTYPTLPPLSASTTIAYATYTSTNHPVCSPALVVSAATSVTEPEVTAQGTLGTATYTPETTLDYDQYDFCSGDGAVTVSDPDWTAFENAQGGNITLDNYADLALLSSDSGYGPNELGSMDDSPSGRDGLPDAANAITIYIRDPATLAAREVVDPDGNDTSTEYNALGDTVSVTKPDGGVTMMLYNPDNEMTESTTVVAGALRTTSYTYNKPYLTAITNPTGNVTKYLQALDGETCEVSRPNKGTNPGACGSAGGDPGWTTTTFDAYGDTATTTDPDGDVTSYAYDVDGEVCGMLSADGYVADGNTPLGSCPSPAGGLYLTAYPYYDDYGDVLQKTTPKTTGSAGNVWLTYYDADGQEVAAMTPNDTSCDGNTTGNCEYATYSAYDPDGSLVSVANDEQGTAGPNTTTYTYNPDGTRLSMVTPDGNASGNNPNNYRTIYSYDDLDRLIATTDPRGGSSCDPETTPLCAYTTYQANDPTGRVIATITPPTTASVNGIETVTTYDGDGNPTEIMTADYTATGSTVISESTSTYDTDDELLSTVQPDGYMSGQTASNWTTSYVYDADGRVSSVTAPAGEGTTSGGGAGAGKTWDFYDADSNEVAVTNGDGNGNTCNAATTLTCSSTTYYAYDVADRLQTVTAAAGQSSSTSTGYTYDADGNPDVVTNPSSVTSTYYYDSADELTSVVYSDGTPTVSYTYNIDGTRASMSASGAAAYDYAYSYDLAQRLTGVTNGAATVASYGYDNSSNVTSLTYPSGLVVTNAYAVDDELQSASWGASKIVSFYYDQAGELITTTARAGSSDPTLTTATSYDGGGRITQVESLSTAQTSPLLVDNYNSGSGVALDADGNPTGEAVTTGTTAQPTNYYDYDYADRANYDSTTDPDGEPVPSPSQQTYTYDKANYVTQGSAVAVSQFYGDGEIETATTTGGAHTSVPFSYDPEQNRIGESISGTTTSYAFSASGVMCWSAPTASIPTGGSTPSCSSPPTGATTYTYDGDGLRNTETTSSGTTTFSWDSQSGVPRLLEDGQNDYIYGPSGTPVAQVALSGGAVDFLLSDREGSVREVASGSTGLSLGYTGYDAYGNPTTSGGLTSLTPVGFQGGYTDATGLVYYEQRYYDPGTGQFMSLDPLNQMTNAGYSFVKDNPFGGTDPSGLEFQEEEGGGEGAGVAPSAAGESGGGSGGGTPVEGTPVVDTYFAPEVPPLEQVEIAADQNARTHFEDQDRVAAAEAALSPEVRSLATAHITDSGDTVLGSLAGSPNYIDKAQVLTASYFDIGDAWDALSPAERTAANNYFLDQIAARGDRVLLSTPKLQIQSGTALSNEIQYLTQQQGYVWVNQWSLRPGG
jgi:RHS repeat-associated protein